MVGNAVGGKYNGGIAVGGKYFGGNSIGGKYIGGNAVGGINIGGNGVGGKYIGDNAVGSKFIGGNAVTGKYIVRNVLGGKYIGGILYIRALILSKGITNYIFCSSIFYFFTLYFKTKHNSVLKKRVTQNYFNKNSLFFAFFVTI